jgi:hypothetical protein
VVGAVRASWEKRDKARVYALAVAACALLSSPAAYAKGAHVENRCARLSNAEYDELDARILLLIENEGGRPELPAVVCTRDGAWVEWAGQRFEVLGRGPLVDEVVDIVETQLHQAERKADADPRTTEASAVAAGQPMLERGGGSAPAAPAAVQHADRVALRPADARGGGLAVGVESELASDSIGLATGPAFDFASSVGPILLGGREAFRFTASKPQVVFMDFEGALSYGAPFNPDARFGGVLRFGAEWMVAYPEGNSGQADVAPVAALGFRVAHSFGLVGLWFGIDSRLRLSPLSLESHGQLRASDVSGSLTLGVSFVDWSRK